MVLNRDFETTTFPAGAQWAGNLLRTKDGWQECKWFGNQLHGWKRYVTAGAAGSIHLEERSPLNERNPHSLRLDAKTPGRGIGVVNSGFWGMNFARGADYDLSFYARTEGVGFEVTAELVDAGGRNVYARAVVRGVSGGWKQYRATLRPRSSGPDGRLHLTVRRAGSIWFDVVSLLPRQTYRNRPNGLRPDLVNLLAGLKPAFVRFPGGAIAGGLNLDNRVQWKNSIGGIAQRKGTMNLWGYYRAVRERSPGVTIISNTRNSGGAPVERVDDHRYGTPASFFDAWGHYNKPDRRGYPVYVGEYGVTRGVGEGNWMAGLAEAAFLLGLERNGDVVRMTANLSGVLTGEWRTAPTLARRGLWLGLGLLAAATVVIGAGNQ